MSESLSTVYEPSEVGVFYIPIDQAHYSLRLSDGIVKNLSLAGASQIVCWVR